MKIPCERCKTWMSAWPHCDGWEEVPDPPTRVVNRNEELYDVFIGRPTIWGNPFRISRLISRKRAIELYREWIISQPELVALIKKELKGKRLGCFCKPKLCHGDVLVGDSRCEGSSVIRPNAELYGAPVTVAGISKASSFVAAHV